MASIAPRGGGRHTAKPAGRKTSSRRPPGTAERVYRELRQRILDNDLAPGTYPEEKLALDLKSNRSLVRQAALRLSEEKLVAVKQHDVHVKPISADDMREIYEILIALEPIAAGRLARRGLKKTDYERLQAAVRQMDEALLKDDLLAWAKADEQFHARLIELCGNRRLAAIVASYWDDLHRVRMQTLGVAPFPVASNRDHAAVVDAVRRGDAEAAYALHHDHMKRALATVLGVLAQRGGDDRA